jgi:hypothetical protein
MITEQTLLDLVERMERLRGCIENRDRRYDCEVVWKRLRKELNDVYGYDYNRYASLDDQCSFDKEITQ